MGWREEQRRVAHPNGMAVGAAFGACRFARPTRIPVSDGATRCTNTPCGICLMPMTWAPRARVPGQWLCRGRELSAGARRAHRGAGGVWAWRADSPQVRHAQRRRTGPGQHPGVSHRGRHRPVCDHVAEAGENTFPRAATSTQDGVFDAADVLGSVSVDRFASLVDVAGAAAGRRPGRPRQLQLGCPAAAGGPERPDRYRRRHRARRLVDLGPSIHPHPHARDAGPAVAGCTSS